MSWVSHLRKVEDSERALRLDSVSTGSESHDRKTDRQWDCGRFLHHHWPLSFSCLFFRMLSLTSFFLFFFLNTFFNSSKMFCLHVHRMHAVPIEARRGHTISLNSSCSLL